MTNTINDLLDFLVMVRVDKELNKTGTKEDILYYLYEKYVLDHTLTGKSNPILDRIFR